MKCLYRNPFIKNVIFKEREPGGSGSSEGSKKNRQMRNNIESSLSYNALAGSLPFITLELNRLDKLTDEMAYNGAKSLIEDLAKNERISQELAQDYRSHLGQYTEQASTYFLDLRAINEVYGFLDDVSAWPGGILPITTERTREMKESMRRNAGVARVFLSELHRLRAQDLPGNPYEQN